MPDDRMALVELLEKRGEACSDCVGDHDRQGALQFCAGFRGSPLRTATIATARVSLSLRK